MSESVHIDITGYDQSIADFLISQGFVEYSPGRVATWMKWGDFKSMQYPGCKPMHFYSTSGHVRIFLPDKNTALLFYLKMDTAKIFSGTLDEERRKAYE